jgi:hypothetical protein
MVQRRKKRAATRTFMTLDRQSSMSRAEVGLGVSQLLVS